MYDQVKVAAQAAAWPLLFVASKRRQKTLFGDADMAPRHSRAAGVAGSPVRSRRPLPRHPLGRGSLCKAAACLCTLLHVTRLLHKPLKRRIASGRVWLRLSRITGWGPRRDCWRRPGRSAGCGGVTGQRKAPGIDPPAVGGFGKGGGPGTDPPAAGWSRQWRRPRRKRNEREGEGERPPLACACGGKVTPYSCLVPEVARGLGVWGRCTGPRVVGSQTHYVEKG